MKASERSLRAGLAVGTFLLALAVAPRMLLGWDADLVFDGDLATQRALGDGVVRSAPKRAGVVYHTGDARFDGQASIAVHQMTVIGLSQIVLNHPELRGRYLPTIREAATRLVDPETLRYASRVYGRHAVVGAAPARGHAYAGYVNLALGMLRAVDPDTPLGALHDRLSESFARQLSQSTTGLIETYPGETWPPDVAAVAGSVGLHAHVTGVDRRALLAAWAARFRSCAVREGGYVVQRVESGTCAPEDAPRGSGTAVSAYFLSFAVPELAGELRTALATNGAQTVLGLTAIREYAAGYDGPGDVNAGPVLFGMSVGATGFALGAAAALRDRALFTGLYRTAELFCVPVTLDGARTHALGGVLGNALLLAMLTARAP